MGNTPKLRFVGFTDAWEQRKVGDITGRTYGGGTPKTSVDDYWGGDIPWIQSSNLEEHRLFDVDIQKHITELGLQKSATQLVPKGSIAVVSHVGVGKLAFIPFEYTTSQDFISLSEMKTEPVFTCYALYKRLRVDQNIVQGSAIKGITKEDLLNKEVSVPDLDEQAKIGVALQSLDNLIILHQRKCKALDSAKQFYLQNMLPQKGERKPKIRFSGFFGDWEQSKCKDIMDKVGIPAEVKEGVLYREIGIRSHGKGLFHKDEVSSEDIGNKRVFWVEPDCFVLNIVFAWERAVAKTTEDEIGMIASHRFPMYKPRAGIADLDYITLFFTTDMGKDILELASPGGAGRNKTLGQAEFANSKIWLPSYDEQAKIGEFFVGFEKTISLYRRKVAALKSLKQFMLQNLFPEEV